MGLSDGERFDGICYCVAQMHKLYGFKNDDFKHLNSLIKKLWPTFLSAKKNSTHWILGGDLDNDCFSETSLVKSAFSNVLVEFIEKKDRKSMTLKDLKKEIPKESMYHYMEEFKPNAYKFLKEEHVYNSKRPEYVYVYKLFRLTETFMYYVNRYKDNLQKNFKNLRDVIATIQGECFQLFSEHSEFFAAYLGEKIINRVLTNKEKDTVNIWFREENLHHDCKIKAWDKPELLTVFKEIRNKNIELNSQRRMEIIFKFINGEFHYDHQHEKLIKIIEEHNKKNKNDKIDSKLIQKLCQDQKNKRITKLKEDEQNYQPYCALTNEFRDI